MDTGGHDGRARARTNRPAGRRIGEVGPRQPRRLDTVPGLAGGVPRQPRRRSARRLQPVRRSRRHRSRGGAERALRAAAGRRSALGGPGQHAAVGDVAGRGGRQLRHRLRRPRRGDLPGAQPRRLPVPPSGARPGGVERVDRQQHPRRRPSSRDPARSQGAAGGALQGAGPGGRLLRPADRREAGEPRGPSPPEGDGRGRPRLPGAAGGDAPLGGGLGLPRPAALEAGRAAGGAVPVRRRQPAPVRRGYRHVLRLRARARARPRVAAWHRHRRPGALDRPPVDRPDAHPRLLRLVAAQAGDLPDATGRGGRLLLRRQLLPLPRARRPAPAVPAGLPPERRPDRRPARRELGRADLVPAPRSDHPARACGLRLRGDVPHLCRRHRRAARRLVGGVARVQPGTAQPQRIPPLPGAHRQSRRPRTPSRWSRTSRRRSAGRAGGRTGCAASTRSWRAASPRRPSAAAGAS